MPGNVARPEPALSLATWADAERLFRSRREALVEVAQPLVLVSQLQRSGGTLVNTLLDGHPELHVHPYELHIGSPTKEDWPVLDLDAGPDAWLETLSELPLERMFEGGYRKGYGNEPEGAYRPLPIELVPSFLDHLFRVLCADRAPGSARAVLDLYFTALFNAWMDYQGLRDEPKRWVAGFAPRAAWGESRARFFGDYPDGRVIASLREPRAWYASASNYSSGRFRDFGEAMDLWRRGAEEIAAAKREAPDAVLVITYEALVTDPRRTMGAVADWLGIAWHPLLERPTVNRMPAVANSSYPDKATEVSSASLEAWRSVLTEEVAAEAAGGGRLELYSEVRSLADVA